MWFVLFSSLILPLPQNVIDYLLDDGTLVVSGRYQTTHTHTHIRLCFLCEISQTCSVVEIMI